MGDFLCSTHVDDLSIYLWANRTLYSHVSLRPLPLNYTPSLFKLPNTALSSEEEANKKEDDENESVTSETELAEAQEDDDIRGDESLKKVTPLSEGLVTLSTLPKSRWHNLQQLDIIKRHNKPTEPPKLPKKAPFFLTTTPGLQPKFISAEEEGDGGIPALEGSGSKILNLGKLVPLSEFQSCLQHCASQQNCKSRHSSNLSYNTLFHPDYSHFRTLGTFYIFLLLTQIPRPEIVWSRLTLAHSN